MVDILEKINDASAEWDMRTGLNREQGNTLITNPPSFLTYKIEWLEELAMKFDSGEQQVIEAYISDALENEQDLSDEIDEINKGLVALGHNPIRGYDAYDSNVEGQLEWLTALTNKRSQMVSLGSDYKVDYKVVEAAPESADETTAAADAEESALGGGASIASPAPTVSATAVKKVEIRILNKEGDVVYVNEEARSSLESGIEVKSDLTAIAFGTLLESKGNKIDKAQIAMVANDPKAVLEEYSRVNTLRQTVTKEFDAFKAKAAKQAEGNTISLSVNSKYVDKAPESANDEAEVTGLTQELQGELTNLRAKQIIVSEQFAGLESEDVEKLAMLARKFLISNISALNESFRVVNTVFQDKKAIETQLNDVIEAITEKMRPKAPADDEANTPVQGSADGNAAVETGEPKEETEDQKSAKESVKEVHQQKLDFIDKVKLLKASYSQFRQAVDTVDEYAKFIQKNGGESLFNWVKSLFDSRRAVQKPLVALVLSAVTAGAGAIIAASSAVAYSLSIALAAYACGRFASIYRIAQRHNVKMADLHTNATYYSSRTEIVVAVIPVLASVVAPFVAAATVASQILSYCGTIALRAVYSAVASLTVNALEVQYDSKNSPKPVDPEVFASTSRQNVDMDDLSTETLQKVNDTMKTMKPCKVQQPATKEGEDEKLLAQPVLDMNAIVDKMVEGKIQQEDITKIPSLLKVDKSDDSLKSVAKLHQLMNQIRAIYDFAQRAESEGNAKITADDIAHHQRTAFAHVRAMPVQ